MRNQTAVYHDVLEGNVFITQDEGKNWDEQLVYLRVTLLWP